MAHMMIWCSKPWHRAYGRTDQDFRKLAAGCYNFGRRNMFDSQKEYGWLVWDDAAPVLPAETSHYAAVIFDEGA